MPTSGYDLALSLRSGFFLKTLDCFLGEVAALAGAVEKKSPDEYVSEIDLKIQRDFRHFVEAHDVPKYPVLGEEGCDEWPPRSEDAWVIDPLDGTHPFLMGFPNFGISVILIESRKVVFVSIFLPVEFLLQRSGFYYAARGRGAWKFSANEAEAPVRLHVSGTKDLKEAALLVDGPTRYRTNSEFVRDLIPRVRKSYHCFAGSVWGSTRIAAASTLPNPADLYINIRSKPWDNLPGALLVEEADGIVVGLDGAPYSIENYETLLYGNQALVGEALRVGA